MNEIRILKWIGLLMIVGVACVLTVFLPTYIFLIGVVILVVGVVRRCRTTSADKGERGGTLIVFGGLLMLPPTAWIASAVARNIW